MKTLSLLSALLLSVSINAYATQDNNQQVATQKIYLADASQADNDVNNSLRLKFISRRAAQNPAVKNKDAYSADDEWVGATYVDEQEDKAGKRLNRQFRSKRPHINYQFD
ncbi:MAG TPA: hypothetical protein VLM20_03215 [Methylophilaceae bacterium]|nr:hypothetical protein [Methylophilaceae bacterium]